MDMNPVADQLHMALLIIACSPDHSGISVVERRHCIVEMSHMARSRFKRSDCRIIICHRVGDGYNNVIFHFTDEFHCPVVLRCDIDQTDQAAGLLLKYAEKLYITSSHVVVCLSA